jgi:hypothetical protein
VLALAVMRAGFLAGITQRLAVRSGGQKENSGMTIAVKCFQSIRDGDALRM